MWLGCLTWKTLGALTSEASAEDRVAEKIPAEIRGAKPDTKLITCVTDTCTSTYLYVPVYLCFACLTLCKSSATTQPAEQNLIKSAKMSRLPRCAAWIFIIAVRPELELRTMLPNLLLTSFSTYQHYRTSASM